MLKEIIQIIIHGFIAYEIFTNIKKLLFKILVLANYMLLILSYIVFYYYQNITMYNVVTFFILINITLYLYVELILKKTRDDKNKECLYKRREKGLGSYHWINISIDVITNI